MNKILLEKLLASINKGILQGLNEAAGTIYNENWEKFIYALFWYVREYYYYSGYKKFSIPKEMFDKCGVEFPGKIYKNKIDVEIVHDDSANASWNIETSKLEINEDIIKKDDKYGFAIVTYVFCEAMIHEFTHGFNFKNVSNNDKYINNKFFSKSYVEDGYTNMKFVNIIKDAIYYFNKTELNARISACGYEISHDLNNYLLVFKKNEKELNLNKLLEQANMILKIDKMEEFYFAFKERWLGNYDKYEMSQKLIKNVFGNNYKVDDDNINQYIKVYELNKILGEIGDIVSFIIWAKKNKKHFMFFKTNADVFNIKSKEDYQKVYDMFQQQVRDEIDNFKKRANKVIYALMQKYYDAQNEIENEKKAKLMAERIHQHIENNKTVFGKIKNIVIDFVHKKLDIK